MIFVSDQVEIGMKFLTHDFTPNCSGRDRRRSGDLTLFRRALCQLSYPTKTHNGKIHLMDFSR